MPIIRKHAKDTLTPVEMNCTDVLEFTLADGRTVAMELLGTHAEVMSTTLKELKLEESRGRTDIRFSCRVRIDGHEHILEREISSQRSFYEPWEFSGMQLWFDCADKVFDFMLETHGPCRPNKNANVRDPLYKAARFAVQDATLGICPEPLHPWCPLPPGGLKIEHCYRGEDCWLGAYNGASAHGGLDINHPPGTPLWVPLDLDTQFYFRTVAQGYINNSWRGIRQWQNGTQWILHAAHMTELTVPERTPVAKGQQFAWGAGVCSGSVHHSHFVFKIYEDGDIYLMDPWILFWQMYRDQHHFDAEKTTASPEQILIWQPG